MLQRAGGTGFRLREQREVSNDNNHAILQRHL